MAKVTKPKAGVKHIRHYQWWEELVKSCQILKINKKQGNNQV
jgi:hypothetical protein